MEQLPVELARRVDAALLGQAVDLSVARLGRRARELVVEFDAAAAEDRRRAGIPALLLPPLRNAAHRRLHRVVAACGLRSGDSPARSPRSGEGHRISHAR